MWRRIWLAAQREYVANVRTKTFVIAVMALPFILAIASAFPVLLEKQRGKPKPFAVYHDGQDGLIADLRQEFDRASNADLQRKFAWQDPAPPIATFSDADRLVANGTLFAYLFIPNDIEGRGHAIYAARNLANQQLSLWVERRLQNLVRRRRFASAGIAEGVQDAILANVPLDTRAVSETGEAKTATKLDKLRAYSPLLFVYLLWIAIMTVAQMLLTNVIEEKSNRVVEILLSSMSSAELMAGKITGVAATGMTMILVWNLTLLGYVRWGLPLVIGQSPAASQKFDSGQLFELAWSLMTAYNLTFFIIYFMLGFVFFAAIFAAIGAICDSVKDAQNLQTPVIMVLMVPLLSMVFITQNPHETIGVVLSYIPPFTPFVMMNRIAATPTVSPWEIVATISLMVVSVGVAYAFAGRVFRVGILMTGKPPTPTELWRIAFTR